MLPQLAHLALAEGDSQKSAGWYEEVLGLEQRHQEVWGDYLIRRAVGSPRVALFPLASGDAAPQVEPAPGLPHLAFRADGKNFAETKLALARRMVSYEEHDHEIARSIYFRDPDGHCHEITTNDLRES